MYSLAYAVGVYVGSKLESRLAFGNIMIQTVTPRARAPQLTDVLRERGFGVTSIQAQGRDGDRSVLMILVARRRRDEVIQRILELDPQAMSTANNATHLCGGHLFPWKRLAK
ncbi:MAG: DUF2179 domain-containing protein [Polyangiaceae bacterium]|nr:DUF2179 domain-containing protein [Polyangiaceae bacterium]